MLNTETFNSANNSSSFKASTHETGSIILTGNFFTDLAARGIDLQGCKVRYYRGENKNGNTITGRFNICGREVTAGATSYEGMIQFLVKVHQEYRRYVRECQQRKRERNRMSWLLKHPEINFNQCNFTFKF